MPTVSIRIGDLHLDQTVEDPYTFIRDFSPPPTVCRDIELIIVGVSMNDADYIRHEKIQITDDHSVLTMRGQNIDTLLAVCRIYLYLKERKYDKKNIEEIKIIITEIARMEFDYITRKAMANLVDEYLFLQLEEEFCYSRYTILDIKWGDEHTLKDRFLKTIHTDYLIVDNILISVKREDAELFLSFLLKTHKKILVFLPNREFNCNNKRKTRFDTSIWEPNRDEFLDFIGGCIRGTGFSLKFSYVGDKVNDEPMYFSATLQKSE